jgi:hypothetical protein
MPLSSHIPCCALSSASGLCTECPPVVSPSAATKLRRKKSQLSLGGGSLKMLIATQVQNYLQHGGYRVAAKRKKE